MNQEIKLSQSDEITIISTSNLRENIDLNIKNLTLSQFTTNLFNALFFFFI